MRVWRAYGIAIGYWKTDDRIMGNQKCGYEETEKRTKSRPDQGKMRIGWDEKYKHFGYQYMKRTWKQTKCVWNERLKRTMQNVNNKDEDIQKMHNRYISRFDICTYIYLIRKKTFTSLVSKFWVQINSVFWDKTELDDSHNGHCLHCWLLWFASNSIYVFFPNHLFPYLFSPFPLPLLFFPYFPLLSFYFFCPFFSIWNHVPNRALTSFSEKH